MKVNPTPALNSPKQYMYQNPWPLGIMNFTDQEEASFFIIAMHLIRSIWSRQDLWAINLKILEAVSFLILNMHFVWFNNYYSNFNKLRPYTRAPACPWVYSFHNYGKDLAYQLVLLIYKNFMFISLINIHFFKDIIHDIIIRFPSNLQHKNPDSCGNFAIWKEESFLIAMHIVLIAW